MKTLITPFEVVKYGPVKKDYPTAYLCSHISRVELKIFKKCYLGKSFYKNLLEDLILPDTIVKPYDVNLTYNIDDLVLYDGIIFQSTVNNNQISPDDDSELDSKWKLPNKFKTDSLNDLWHNYMAGWLSLEILYRSIRYSTYQAGAKGLVKLVDDPTGIVTVSKEEFLDYKRELKIDAQDALENLYEFMLDESIAGNELYLGIDKISNECNLAKCVSPKKRRHKRFNFKY